MERDEQGKPILLMEYGGSSETGSWSVFTWQDSAWTISAGSAIPGFSVIQRALALVPPRRLVWLSDDPDGDGFHHMLMAEFTSNGIGPPDTAMTTLGQSTERGGAASAHRRWVVRSQSRFPENAALAIRTVYSDEVGAWHELPELGVDEDHCTIAPLDDTSALVVYAGESGLAWAIAEGSDWKQRGNLDPRRFRAAHPRFRFRPSGGLWLLWTESLWVHMSYFRDGQWFRGDSLQAAHPPGQTFWAGWCDMTHEDGERPVIAWGDLGVGTTFRDVGVIAFPTETGWSQGEEIPGSDDMFLTPYVARDVNGDVWAAWRLRRSELNRWTHTYVRATTSPPTVSGVGHSRTVVWTLSEPAPESWWAVLCARNDGPFEQVARIQAGSTTDVWWTDTSPPAGVLRYRIRRESLDARYRWESEDGFWPPKNAKPFTLARAAGASLADGQLELTGADAGTFKLAIYDIQGRLVLERESRAAGDGRDTVRLDFGEQARSLPNGIYFASVKDASGRATNFLKVVLLR